MTTDTNERQQHQLLSIAEALQIIKDNLHRPQDSQCSLEAAIGCYLSGDVRAPEPSPRYTNSAMDGYALRWQDAMAASAESPAVLRIVGESQAGARFAGVVGPGEAVRISTGAMLAEGCDSVVRMEDTSERQGQVLIYTAVNQGQDIRYRGEEFAAGDLLLEAGTRVNAPSAALLASVGIDRVDVFRPCRVAVVVTGSELVSTADEIGPDQIRDSNMLMLKAAVAEAGGRVVQSIRVADEAQATTEAIAATAADIVLCSGGISVGRHDHVKKAAGDCGYSTLFWRIRQKPGKPLFFARRENTLLFGLPGNPVSAFMCFTHYVRPLILALNGLPFGWPMISAAAAADIVNGGRRPNMVRVKLQWRPNSGYFISNASRQGSHMLTSLTGADGYILLEPGQKLKAGERVDVYRYDSLREPLFSG